MEIFLFRWRINFLPRLILVKVERFSLICGSCDIAAKTDIIRQDIDTRLTHIYKHEPSDSFTTIMQHLSCSYSMPCNGSTFLYTLRFVRASYDAQLKVRT